MDNLFWKILHVAVAAFWGANVGWTIYVLATEGNYARSVPTEPYYSTGFILFIVLGFSATTISAIRATILEEAA